MKSLAGSMPISRGWLLLPALLGLAGCESMLTAGTADVAGIAGAGLASSISKSAVAATAIGLGVAAGANAGLQYAERRVHRGEQDSIAGAAGDLPPGTVGRWGMVHTLPIEANEHGDLVVTRAFGGVDFTCKEVVFSVETEAEHQVQRAFYTATVCRDGARWKWASAEPATERWGSLQ